MRTPPQLWALMHTDPQGSPMLLRTVFLELPCRECRLHFQAYQREDPPAYGAGWFAWTVRFHNAVNVRLGRAPWTLEEAARMWGRVPLTVSAR